MEEDYEAASLLKSLLSEHSDLEARNLPPDGVTLTLPAVPSQSLYKSDPKRNNPASRIFTRQHDIDRLLAKISELPNLDLLSSRHCSILG
jgi:hypothetical protein